MTDQPADVLSKWEAEATEDLTCGECDGFGAVEASMISSPDGSEPCPVCDGTGASAKDSEDRLRIIALIDLVRRKDVALKNAVGTLDANDWPVVNIWKEALALTEKLEDV